MSRASKINSRNTSTKNFFNFSYKRYRFHFGIYIPCSYDHIIPGFSGYTPPKTICKILAPFIMSDFRRACVLHQPSFFKNNVFTFFKNPKKALNIDHTTPSVNPKIYHANLLYTRWNTHRTKRIYSRRLGISFEEMIHARDRYSSKYLIINIYIGKNFLIFVSDIVTTLEQHKLATVQRYQFMFSESQFVLKPIKHLLYNHGLHHRNYKFWTPFFGRPGKRITTIRLDDTSSPNIIYTVASYNPIPNMFIPHKYRNIIPKEPLYTEEGVYIVPGSREWFTYMYNLHINLPPPLTKAQHHALRLENERIENIRQIKEEAILKGTSTNRVGKRRHLAFTLTRISERFHDEMMDYTTQYLASDDKKTKSHTYKIMSDYTIRYIEGANLRVGDSKRSRILPPGVTEDTSDNAKELELRPKKRRISSHTNLYPLIDNTDRFKHRRLTPAIMDDSIGAEFY
ncbi:hypothetical protein RhiirC2_832594 [Rhizophagus irregularis]|uniref:DUF8211 domain-containing protein n=1 Tax=Rhizophagus irregularis TaxID=588596 RepID=A0A2N1N5C7_9GLOM|nr:hypothetical protein RhiirC2_832594 [Rhizophagus irregularis]